MGKGKDDKKNSSIDAIPEEENPQEKKITRLGRPRMFAGKLFWAGAALHWKL